METVIPWGMSVPPPIEDIKQLANPQRLDSVIDLGSGDPNIALILALKLGCLVVACDNSPEQFVHVQLIGLDFPELPIYYYFSDLTSPYNPLLFLGRLSRLFGQTQGEENIVLANNLFVNLTDKPRDTSIVAASIAYALQTNGWIFFLDHLRKDQGPFGTSETQALYRKRYAQAQLAGRPSGDVWTSSPPRWVHHFTWDEIKYFFPPEWYDWRITRTVPYTGDSGRTTNSCYLAAQKTTNIDDISLARHFSLPIGLFEIS